MSASKLAEQIAASYCSAIEDGERLLYEPGVVQALEEMALRVFEDTRERAAKLLLEQAEILQSKNIAPEWVLAYKAGAEAIRAMQPELGDTK